MIFDSLLINKIWKYLKTKKSIQNSPSATLHESCDKNCQKPYAPLNQITYI
jgi:hypothetical protein